MTCPLAYALSTLHHLFTLPRLLPAARAGHSMTLLPAESYSEDCNPKLLCFAGGDITAVYNDVHVLDMETLCWSPQETSGPVSLNPKL